MCGLYLIWDGIWWYLRVVGMVSSQVSWPVCSGVWWSPGWYFVL